LGVTRDSTLTEIRQEYLRLARQCHPDKNPDDPKATKISKSYTLCNVHWSQSPCDSRPGVGEKKSKQNHTFQHESRGTVNLWLHSSSESYPAPDSNTGFYTVFRKLVQDIAYWEMKCKENTGNLPPPSSERSDTPLQDVKGFYNYWPNFSTKLYVQSNDQQDWVLIPNKTPLKKQLFRPFNETEKQFIMDVRS
ncbi:DnaJ subfamily C member 21-like 5, partial [Homarus americanus]